MRIRLLRLVLRCSWLFLIMTVTIITVSVYKHSRDHSLRPLHDIVEMKQLNLPDITKSMLFGIHLREAGLSKLIS